MQCDHNNRYPVGYMVLFRLIDIKHVFIVFILRTCTIVDKWNILGNVFVLGFLLVC